MTRESKKTGKSEVSVAKTRRQEILEKRLQATRESLEKREKRVISHTEKFLRGRLGNLLAARRVALVWVVIIAILLSAAMGGNWWYMNANNEVAAASGGIYAEGVVDKIATINPLFATTTSEKAASQLVYAGLFEYDDTAKLKPDLAESFSRDAEAKIYTVKLKSGLVWSDGEKLTVDDVVFTVNLMKNAGVDAQNSAMWKSISVKSLDQLTVEFTLPEALNSFEFALTFGILPQHVLAKVAAGEMRHFAIANPLAIVGSGAWMLKNQETTAEQQTVLTFAPNAKFYGGKARIKTFILRTYADDDAPGTAFKVREINAMMAGYQRDLAAQTLLGAKVEIAKIGRNNFAKNVASNLTSGDLARLYQITTNDGVFALFNNTSEFLSDQSVREALRFGADRESLRQSLARKIKNSEGKVVQLAAPEALETPIARGIFAEVDKLAQPAFDPVMAAKKLDDAGWKLNAKGVREKDGRSLTISVATLKDANYAPAAKKLAEDWKKVGVDARLEEVDAATFQQNVLIPRNYDVLVYQLELGADADVFAYWHSSQVAPTKLNFANYRSAFADVALAGARTKNDGREASRYANFAKIWLGDAPAIALYQTKFYYAADGLVRTLDGSPLVNIASRFYNSVNWTANMAKVRKTP